MKELVAALLLANTKKPVTTNNENNLGQARLVANDIRVYDGKTWVTLFTKDQVLEALEDTTALVVGSKVEAEVKGEWKQGIIKNIGYQVDGLGNKFYSEDDLMEVK